MGPISLLVSLDQAYLPQLQVLLTSLYLNNPGERFDLYLLHSEIPAHALAPVTQQCLRLQYHLYPILMEEQLFADAPTTKQYPREMYYRLLAGTVLPRQLNRILYPIYWSSIPCGRSGNWISAHIFSLQLHTLERQSLPTVSTASAWGPITITITPASC